MSVRVRRAGIHSGDWHGLDFQVSDAVRAWPVFAPTVCSTTNYTDIAAKALGMTSAELRQALVGGKNLSQIASSKQVTLQTVEAALTTAREADLQQAVTDGLLTQQQYDQLKSRLDQAAGNAANAPAPATPAASSTRLSKTAPTSCSRSWPFDMTTPKSSARP